MRVGAFVVYVKGFHGGKILPAQLIGAILLNHQDLGYPLELGYQNFLYPSEPDLRDLLLFLAERLPTDASEDAGQPAGMGCLGCGRSEEEGGAVGAERGGGGEKVDWWEGGRGLDAGQGEGDQGLGCPRWSFGAGRGSSTSPAILLPHAHSILTIPASLFGAFQTCWAHLSLRPFVFAGLFFPQVSWLTPLPLGGSHSCHLREAFLRLPC